MNRIKQLRTSHRMKQSDLAHRLCVKPNTISYWENGKYEPSFDMLQKMADVFDVSIDYLLGRDEKEKPTPEDRGGQDDPLRTILLHNFDLLNQEGREKLVDTSDDMVSSGKYIKSDPDSLGKKA